MKDTHATVQYAGNDYFVAVPPSGHAITLDINGERSNASGPLELLLVALGGCTGADVISVLHKKRQQVTDYRIEIRGERREEHPRGFKRMEVSHIVTGYAISEEAWPRLSNFLLRNTAASPQRFVRRWRSSPATEFTNR